MLYYLNRLRTNNDCINFILKENVLEALHKVYKKNCDDELKRRYSDLFTLADEFEAGNESDEEQSDESENDSDNDSDSKNTNKKMNTSKGSNNSAVRGRTKSKAGSKQSGNKRVIRVPSSKLPHKKIKLRNQNSSGSEKDARNESNTDESDEVDSESDSENKSFKNTRKK